MGHRLSKITTRTGDDGTTGLGDGSRTAKDSPRIEAIGAVDELNSCIGLLLAENPGEPTAGCLLEVQHDLFELGGELSIPGAVRIAEEHIRRLEAALEEVNRDLPPLKEFILPGGCRAAACAHLARTVCRRAERRVVSMGPGAISPCCRRYLNRLSDLLFVLSRLLNRRTGHPDLLWQRGKAKPDA
ncbi:MAG: cob(I)yrinic acid a,c-diamide adenosyltransferase [Betaproteobacteria bacterium]|nr:MAG: cob(I)yrinic acid a,c-diamide adenosyltransferase [Betaproteobacteria bacterium]